VSKIETVQKSSEEHEIWLVGSSGPGSEPNRVMLAIDGRGGIKVLHFPLSKWLKDTWVSGILSNGYSDTAHLRFASLEAAVARLDQYRQFMALQYQTMQIAAMEFPTWNIYPNQVGDASSQDGNIGYKKE
jgi:hypothetical protein